MLTIDNLTLWKMELISGFRIEGDYQEALLMENTNTSHLSSDELMDTKINHKNTSSKYIN